jgi:hypothetical protein
MLATFTLGVLKAMFKTKLTMLASLAVVLGAIGITFGVYQTRAIAAPGPGDVKSSPSPEKKDSSKDEDKINLPAGQPPVQVLASLDKDGKLVIKTLIYKVVLPPGGGPGGGPGILPPNPAPPVPPGPGGPAVGGPVRGGPPQLVPTLQATTYDLDDVKVLDTAGKEVDKKDVAKLLKDEVVAMAFRFGQTPDPLHLRVLKDGTLTFVLPIQKNVPGLGGPGGPGILPVPPIAPLPPIPAPPPGGGTVPAPAPTPK